MPGPQGPRQADGRSVTFVDVRRPRRLEARDGQVARPHTRRVVVSDDDNATPAEAEWVAKGSEAAKGNNHLIAGGLLFMTANFVMVFNWLAG